jgi:hypothetical protein
MRRVILQQILDLVVDPPRAVGSQPGWQSACRDRRMNSGLA